MMFPAPSNAAGARRPGLARYAEATAALALLTWVGGLVALGAFAAPVVFGQLDRETAGSVMGTIFRRFDGLVVGAVAVFALAEAARVFAAGGLRERWGRIRLALAGLIVACGLAASVYYSPRINDMFHRGVRRGVGAEGALMDTLHHRAETAGKAAVAAAVAWLFLGAAGARRVDVPAPDSAPEAS